MDTAQWPEGIGVVRSMEEKKAIRPQAVTCPRCNSTHTKFCYYNNYSLSQPRYFCKTCRRYWTEGGSLRNVPVGGGSRRNKRSTSSSSLTSMSSSSSSSSAAAASLAASMSKNDHNHMMMTQQVPNLISQNPSKHIIQNHGGQDQGQSQSQGQDLTLAYPNASHGFVDLHYNMCVDHEDNKTYHPNTTNSCSSQFSEFLKNGTANSRGVIMNSFMSMPVADSDTMIMNSQGLNISLDGFENGGGYDHHNTGIISLQGGDDHGAIDHQETVGTTSASARLFFPFEDLKPISASTSEVLEPSRGGQGASSSNGYWNGGLGGGSWQI